MHETKQKGATKTKGSRVLHRKVDSLRREMHKEFEEVNFQLRVITKSLAPFMQVDKDFILNVVCRDEVDEALLDYLRSKGRAGITPTEACAATELRPFTLKPFQVTRRIQRMNRRLKENIDKTVATNNHRRWIITLFAQKAWNETKSKYKTEEIE